MKNIILIPFLLGLVLGASTGQSFYKEPPLFSKRPDEKKSSFILERFGPVGLSLELIQPAFMMRIKSVEPGSPASKTDLKAGQIIASINRETLKDIDPRIQLGDMISAAEAKDGILKLLVADKPGAATREVTVTIPVLGAFSKTWPLDCPKSDKIVRNYAEYLKKPGADMGLADMGMLFLLSTGDPADTEFVGQWARGLKAVPTIPWHLGYGGLALCEYYLRTGDKEVLPILQARADKLVEMENNGGWGQREPMTAMNYGGGGGHLNAAGVLCAAYLIMAKECGATIPEETLQRVIAHYYRFAGRGNVPYGNGKPETGFTDNGKNGKNAIVMAAAANLTPNGGKSVYARARDTTSQFAFYSTGYMLHGHTGGGIGEIWRSATMGLLHDKTPKHYREFMDGRRWHYELSRRFDGSFGIVGGERYDNPEWGVGYALTFTVPRKSLRLTGAPVSRFSKQHQLPERPWGTAEDDDFESIVGAKLPDGSVPDLSGETLAESTGLALIMNRGKTKLDEAKLLHYLHHPNFTVRQIYDSEILKQKPEFLDALLKHDDARIRRVALDCLDAAPSDALTPRRLDILRTMLADENESWFVKEVVLRLIAKAPKAWVIAQLDLILPYLEHKEWWLRQSTLVGLTPVLAEEGAYPRVIPAIGKMLRSNHIYNITGPVRWGKMPELIRNAPPAVQDLARKEFQDAYAHYEPVAHHNDYVNQRVDPTMREFLAETLSNVPGGFDALYQVSKERSPAAALPYADLYLKADPEKFSPELKKEVDRLVKTRLIPRFIGDNRELLLKEAANENLPPRFGYGEARIVGLAGLYKRIGYNEFGWRDFGPAPTDMKWHYFSFDPPEALAWDSGKTRYRTITFPKGTEDFHKPTFDPAAAGWKSGRAPFGAINGKLETKQGSCPLDFCRHGEPMKTLWEKEVLLLKGRFQFPALKEGHRYRLLIGGMSHVSAGEGFRLYVNGKLFHEQKRAVDRREGAKPIGSHIHRDWWADFNGGETELSFVSFMGGKPGWQNRHLMIWIQEMKLPPVGEKEILESITVTPMRSSAWQALQDLDRNDLNPEEGRFVWNGTFQANPALTGKWKTAGFVEEIEAFNPAKPQEANRAPVQELTFRPDGKTNDPLWIWSGNTLMNLRKNEALDMLLEKRGDTEFLLIQAGGFETKKGMDWTSPWFIMKRP
jgi:hypothetical protein